MERVSTVRARQSLSELVNRVAYGGESIVLTRRGRDVALVCPVGTPQQGTAFEDLIALEPAAEYAASAGAIDLDAPMTTQVSQATNYSSHSSLSALFASQTLVEVLRLLLLHKGRRFHQRELARLTGAGLRSVQSETRRLERLGLLSSVSTGGRRDYILNERHPAVSDLRRLFVRSFAVPEIIATALERFGDAVVGALLYGSAARGDETADSDVDLLVIGGVDGVDLAAALEGVESLIGRTVNATVYPVDEYRDERREGNHFLTSVLAGPTVWVKGDVP